MNSRDNRTFDFYCFCLMFLLCVGSAAAALRFPVLLNPVSLSLLTLVVIAETLAVVLQGGTTISISYPLSVAALLLLNPTTGALIASASGFNLGDIRRRKPTTIILCNVSQIGLAALVSGLAYSATGGPSLLLRTPSSSDFPRLVVPVLALAGSSVLLNAFLVSVGLKLLKGVSLRTTWSKDVVWMLPTQLSLAALGFCIAYVVMILGPVGLLLFLFPLLVARQVFERYVALRRAYLDVVRTLVSMIEEKDSYTCGHSERVAQYAVAVAVALGVDERGIDRVELAALLHDVGKIGVAASTLTKPGTLSESERSEIQRHPETGAGIVGAIPFLEEIIPAIRHHHERYDGKGYVAGLSGRQIPEVARILAVADSFDAMTSCRPYRPALSYATAMDELVRNAGTQFDPTVVEKFASAVTAATLESAQPTVDRSEYEPDIRAGVV